MTNYEDVLLMKLSRLFKLKEVIEETEYIELGNFNQKLELNRTKHVQIYTDFKQALLNHTMFEIESLKQELADLKKEGKEEAI